MPQGRTKAYLYDIVKAGRLLEILCRVENRFSLLPGATGRGEPFLPPFEWRA